VTVGISKWCVAGRQRLGWLLHWVSMGLLCCWAKMFKHSAKRAWSALPGINYSEILGRERGLWLAQSTAQ